jgi:hypothetical protein
MTLSETADNTVLVLHPPMVNGQTQPVIDAHIGVPCSGLFASGLAPTIGSV